MCQPHVILYKFCACRGDVVMKPCRDPSPPVYSSSNKSSSTTVSSEGKSERSRNGASSNDECPSAPSQAAVLKMRLSQLPTIELHCYCEIHSAESFTTKRKNDKKMQKRKGKKTGWTVEEEDAGTDMGQEADGEKQFRKWELEARAGRLKMRDAKGQGHVLEASRKSIVEVMRGLRASRIVQRN